MFSQLNLRGNLEISDFQTVSITEKPASFKSVIVTAYQKNGLSGFPERPFDFSLSSLPIKTPVKHH
jgi:hypothetical protein